VTDGLWQLYQDDPWRLRLETVAPPPVPEQDANPYDNNIGLGNEEDFDVKFPTTTDINFQDIYNYPEKYKLYLYDASNAVNNAQIAGPIAIDQAFTNLANGDYKIAVYAKIGNGLTFSETITVEVDNEPPTGNITSTVENITNLDSFEVTFNFSEPINTATFSLSDITKTNCNLSNLVWNGDNTAVTVTGAPQTEVDVSLWVNANKFKDLAGNWNLAIAPWTVIFDETGSVITFTTPEYPKTNENPISFTMTIEEPNGINGLDQSDINAVGGTVTNWNYSGGNSATFDLVTDGTNGDYSVSTTEGAFTDDAGNPNQAGSIEGEKDYEAPYSTDGFQCAVGELTNLSSFPMSIQFNETLADFTSGKLNLNNCTVTNFQNNGNGNYSWNVHPSSDGFVAVSMDAGVCHDFLPGGNGNIIVPAWSTTYDGTAITGEMASATTSPTNDDIIPVEGSVSELPFGLDASDFEVDNGSLENITFDGQNFGFDIVPSGDGLITVTVPAGSFTDEAGNPNEEFWFTIVSDQTSPEIETSYEETSPTNADIIHVNFIANENINLSADNITVENGTLVSLSGSDDSYTGEIEPTQDGEVKTVIANYSDNAGNIGVTDSTSIESDRTAPQITTTGPASVYSGNDAEMAYTATEPIVGFDNSDIEVDNGESVNFAGNGANWSSTITGMTPGQTHVNVTGDYYDIAGNAGLAVEEFTIDIITGTPELSSIEGVKVYPNPAKNIVNIEAGERIVKFILVNVTGQNIPKEEYSATISPLHIQVDVSALPKGIYFVKTTTQNGHTVFTKFIKN
jgi:hypothetical protein